MCETEYAEDGAIFHHLPGQGQEMFLFVWIVLYILSKFKRSMSCKKSLLDSSGSTNYVFLDHIALSLTLICVTCALRTVESIHRTSNLIHYGDKVYRCVGWTTLRMIEPQPSIKDYLLIMESKDSCQCFYLNTTFLVQRINPNSEK